MKKFVQSLSEIEPAGVCPKLSRQTLDKLNKTRKAIFHSFRIFGQFQLVFCIFRGRSFWFMRTIWAFKVLIYLQENFIFGKIFFSDFIYRIHTVFSREAKLFQFVLWNKFRNSQTYFELNSRVFYKKCTNKKFNTEGAAYQLLKFSIQNVQVWRSSLLVGGQFVILPQIIWARDALSVLNNDFYSFLQTIFLFLKFLSFSKAR